MNWKAQGLEFKDVSELPVLKILNSSRIFVPNKEKKLVGRLFRKDRVKSYLEENIWIWQIRQNPENIWSAKKSRSKKDQNKKLDLPKVHLELKDIKSKQHKIEIN